jgi:hypothetical protein
MPSGDIIQTVTLTSKGKTGKALPETGREGP